MSSATTFPKPPYPEARDVYNEIDKMDPNLLPSPGLRFYDKLKKKWYTVDGAMVDHNKQYNNSKVLLVADPDEEGKEETREQVITGFYTSLRAGDFLDRVPPMAVAPPPPTPATKVIAPTTTPPPVTAGSDGIATRAQQQQQQRQQQDQQRAAQQQQQQQ